MTLLREKLKLLQKGIEIIDISSTRHANTRSGRQFRGVNEEDITSTTEQRYGSAKKKLIFRKEGKGDRTTKTGHAKQKQATVQPKVTKKTLSIVNRYTPEEKAIWELITTEGRRGTVLFDNNRIYISDIKVLRSLMPGEEVDGEIIDCMTCVLNYEEEQRTDDTGKRLFCSRDVLLNWMLKSTNNDEESRMHSFAKGIFQALGKIEERRDLKGYALVFIPILEHSHYYLVVFDLKKPSIYLLDNICEEKTLVEVYDNKDYFDKSTSYKVKDLFVAYLKSVGHINSEKMAKCVIQRPALPWATSKNKFDCGVFAMRHMEVFRGGNIKHFACGFNNEEGRQYLQILTLRKKYAARILLSDINISRQTLMQEAGLE